MDAYNTCIYIKSQQNAYLKLKPNEINEFIHLYIMATDKNYFKYCKKTILSLCIFSGYILN